VPILKKHLPSDDARAQAVIGEMTSAPVKAATARAITALAHGQGRAPRLG
jgi:hypothetical protein